MREEQGLYDKKKNNVKMSTHNTSKKPHQSKKNASEEISEMPREENSAHRPDPPPPGFAVSKRVTQVDLTTAVDFNSRNQNRSSFSKICQVLKQRSNSQGKTPLLCRGTQNRGRFLSLDSSDIFRTRSGNSNRRSSWYGGNIRNTSLRKYSKTRQSINRTRRCSKASVQTLDSDGLPVHCGLNFDVTVDVHRTASGTPVTVDSGIGKVHSTENRFALIESRKPNTIINVEPSSDTRKSLQNVPEIVVDKTELYEFNGRFCKWWLRSIDKMTRRCPGCSPYLGPVLITISLCTGFAIVLTVIVLFSWIFVKVGSWWA